MTDQELEQILSVIMMHEEARPGFRASEYTDEQWSAITRLITYLEWRKAHARKA